MQRAGPSLSNEDFRMHWPSEAERRSFFAHQMQVEHSSIRKRMVARWRLAPKVCLYAELLWLGSSSSAETRQRSRNAKKFVLSSCGFRLAEVTFAAVGASESQGSIQSDGEFPSDCGSALQGAGWICLNTASIPPQFSFSSRLLWEFSYPQLKPNEA